VGEVGRLDPLTLVAPVQPLQTQAAATAAGLTASPWNFDAAADLARGAANTSWTDSFLNAPPPSAAAGQASQFVGRYMDPYLGQVVDATSADLDASDGRVRAQQALQLAKAGAFGGSGAALTQSLTEGELARARAAALGQLRSQGYQTALSAATGDAERATQAAIADAQLALQARQQQAQLGLSAQQQQLAAGQALAGLSSAFDADRRADIATQLGAGDALRGIAQQQAQAPAVTTQQIVAMLSGLPIQLFTGQDQQGVQASASNSATNSNTSRVGSSHTDGSSSKAEVGFSWPL
jgi:hypothetical protein